MRRYRFVFLLIVVSSISLQLFGQTRLDSMKALLASLHGKDRIPILLFMSQQNLFVDAKQSKAYAEEALVLSQKASDIHGCAESYYYLGFSEYRQANYQPAIDYLQKSVDLHSSQKNYTLAAGAKNMIAIINYFIGRYEISVKLYSQNLIYYKSRNMMFDYCKMLTNIAQVYTKKGDFKKAIEDLSLAESYFRKNAADNGYIMGNIVCSLGEAYFGEGEYTLASQKYFEAIDYFQKINLVDAIASTQMDIGLLYLATKAYPKAIFFFNAAMQSYQSIHYDKGIMDVKECIIRYYKAAGLSAKALEETRGLEAMCEVAKDSLMLATCYSHYADIYEGKKDFAASSKYFRKYFDLKGRIEQDQNRQNMIGLMILTDAEEKDLENLTLKEENDVQKERIKVNTIIISTVTIILLLISAFLYILYKKQKNIRVYAALLEKKNEESKQQNAKLEEAIQAKNKFFSIIAHDLRSPFTGLLGLTEFVMESSEDLPHTELQSIIGKLHASVKNLYTLLKNLLEWTQLQQNSMPLNVRVINIRKVIDFNVNLLAPLAEKKELRVACELPQDVSVLADEAMLNSVMGNFLSNAVKFTDRGGSISVSTVIRDADTLEISVADTGIGMPADMLDKLFKINEKVGRAGTEGEASTGLGLILSKEFIERNGGKIRAESRENEGSTFSFTLPIFKE